MLLDDTLNVHQRRMQLFQGIKTRLWSLYFSLIKSAILAEIRRDFFVTFSPGVRHCVEVERLVGR